MTEQKIELQDLELSTAASYAVMSAYKDTDLEGKHVPAATAISWSWKRWRLTPDFLPISDELRGIIEQFATNECAIDASRRDIRGLYEWVTVICGITSGDRDVMRRAADVVAGAVGNDRNQNYEAAAGILKARILGTSSDERREIEAFERSKPDGVYPVPTKALVRAFVDRDYSTLDKEITKGAKKHWTDRYIGGKVVVKNEPDSLVLNIRKKHAHFTWPYVEAAFAKLAIMDGATITHDDLWFPLDFVKSLKEPS